MWPHYMTLVATSLNATCGRRIFNLLTDRTGYHLVPVDCTGGRRFKLVEL